MCIHTTEHIQSTVKGSMNGTVFDTPQMLYIRTSHSIYSSRWDGHSRLGLNACDCMNVNISSAVFEIKDHGLTIPMDC